MSRINAGIPPQYLTDQHLLAEHREIKRICHLYNERIAANKPVINLVKEFTLGEGHMLFFLDKGGFTFMRYYQLKAECLKRGFIVENYSKNWNVFSNIHYKGWQPSKKDNIIVINRITERLRNSKQIPYYYSKPITVEEAVNLIRKAI